MQFLLARWTNSELHALFSYTPLVLQKSLTETEVYMVVDEWSSRIEAVNVEVLISICPWNN